MQDSEPGEITSTVKKSLFDLERSHTVHASREEGERELSNMAHIAKQEYVWAFDEEASAWYYHLSSKHSEKVDRVKGRAIFTCRVPESILLPPSDNSIFYHIHPDAIANELLPKPKKGHHSREFIKVSNQMPKTEDLELAVKLISKGYKECRIVTTNGITIYRFHPERLKDEEILPQLIVPSEDIYKALEQQGIKGGIGKFLEYMNNHYQGIFTFSFEAF